MMKENLCTKYFPFPHLKNLHIFFSLQAELSVYSEDKVTIKVEHEPLQQFQIFYGNDHINPLEHFYKNPTHNGFFFQNYVLDVYQ